MTDAERIAELEAQNAQLVADLATARTTSNAAEASMRDAVAADRQRRQTIMSMPEASGREDLAEHLFLAGMDENAARAALGSAPVASTSSGRQTSDAAAHEHRRLNGEGLNVNSRGSARLATATTSTAANMRKLLASGAASE